MSEGNQTRAVRETTNENARREGDEGTERLMMDDRARAIGTNEDVTKSGAMKLEFYRLCTVCGDDVNESSKKTFYKNWSAHCESERHQRALEDVLERKRAKRVTARSSRPTSRPATVASKAQTQTHASTNKSTFPFYRVCRVCGGEIAAMEEPTFKNNWKQHVAGSKHMTALRAQDPKRSMSVDRKSSSGDEKRAGDLLTMTCRLCNHEIRGPTKSVLDNNFQQHVLGMMHRRNLFEREQKKIEGEPIAIENDFDALSVEEIDLSLSEESSTANEQRRASADVDSARKDDAKQNDVQERRVAVDEVAELGDWPALGARASARATVEDFFYTGYSTPSERPTLVNAIERDMDVDSAYIGREITWNDDPRSATRERDVFLNVCDPFCVVTCGLQGYGKSNTVAVLTEACLLPYSEPVSAPIVHLRQPMVALAFMWKGRSDELMSLSRVSSRVKSLLQEGPLKASGIQRVVVQNNNDCYPVSSIDEKEYPDVSFAKQSIRALAKRGTLIIACCDEDNAISDKLGEFFRLPKSLDKLLILDKFEGQICGGIAGIEHSMWTWAMKDVVDAVRNMRQLNLRVVISALSPFSIPEEIFEELTMCVLHNFHSERWFEYVRHRLGLVLPLGSGVNSLRDLARGEALVFAKRVGASKSTRTMKMHIRPRITGEPDE